MNASLSPPRVPLFATPIPPVGVAEIRMVEGVLYCNDGDWVESLVEWREIRQAAPALAAVQP